jgi:hypothetical protein
MAQPARRSRSRADPAWRDAGVLNPPATGVPLRITELSQTGTWRAAAADPPGPGDAVARYGRTGSSRAAASSAPVSRRANSPGYSAYPT